MGSVVDSSRLVEGLRAGVDGLLAVELSGLPAGELTALVGELEVQRRRLEAVDQRLLAEIEQRGLSHEYGRQTSAQLLASLVRLRPGEARARVARARDLGPRRGLSGQVLAPILPVCAAAVAAGQLSAGHVEVIAQTLEAVPAGLGPAAGAVAEAVLVEAARHEHPGQLARTAALLLARLDPDGVEPRERAIERQRGFTLLKRRDGSTLPRGLLTAEASALLETLFDALAAPTPAVEGMPDDRSAAQRRHDALAEAATRLLRSATLPTTAGVPVTLLARISATDLTTQLATQPTQLAQPAGQPGQPAGRSGAGVAVEGHGGQLSVAQLMQLAGDAEIIPVVCTDTGGILAYGRTRRLASRGQRLALAARDGGCCFPGCDRPPAWCEVHHLTAWLDGGTTDLDNLCLLCRYHHREFARHDWQPTMIDDIPHWIPPPWLDPDRTPIRNTAHHLDDLHLQPHLARGA